VIIGSLRFGGDASAHVQLLSVNARREGDGKWKGMVNTIPPIAKNAMDGAQWSVRFWSV
jgi:hypothetical protein